MRATESNDHRIRAYVVANSMAFLREAMGKEEAALVEEKLSPEARFIVTKAKPADWSSAGVYSEITAAIAETARGDEARARDTLVAAGEFVSREATNTFLKLMMKLLSPSMFAKKLPDIWRRDCSGGRLEVEAGDERLVCRLLGMNGLSHLPCTAAGFVKFALANMGKTTETVTIHNWSLDKPCANDAWFELTWKN